MDGLPAYHKAFNDEFFTKESQRSQHINAIKLTGHDNTANNKKNGSSLFRVGNLHLSPKCRSSISKIQKHS